MKTIKIEKTVYSFEDLKTNASVKANVLEKQKDINVDHDDWYDFVYEQHKEDLEKLGFVNPEIQFSGFWSQGDGASFTSTRVDIGKWIQANNPVKYARLTRLMSSDSIELSGEVKRDRNSHYVHENTTSFYLDSQMYGRMGASAVNVSNLIDELETEIQETLRPLNKEIYKSLETSYDDLTSEESILETLEVNEYKFNEDGSIY